MRDPNKATLLCLSARSGEQRYLIAAHGTGKLLRAASLSLPRQTRRKLPDAVALGAELQVLNDEHLLLLHGLLACQLQPEALRVVLGARAVKSVNKNNPSRRRHCTYIVCVYSPESLGSGFLFGALSCTALRPGREPTHGDKKRKALAIKVVQVYLLAHCWQGVCLASAILL